MPQARTRFPHFYRVRIGCAEYPPPPQGAQRLQRAGTHSKCGRILNGARGRVGVGVSDIAHEMKLLFFNDFAALTPASLLLRKQCLLLRELPQSQRERGLSAES